MKLIEKALRAPLATEILALLEKIDAIDSREDEAYSVIERLVNTKPFGRYEKAVIARALHKIERRDTLTATMHVVVTNKMPRSRFERDINEQFSQAYQNLRNTQNSMTGTTTLMQGATGSLMGAVDARGLYGNIATSQSNGTYLTTSINANNRF
jgi:hypothetical protein